MKRLIVLLVSILALGACKTTVEAPTPGKALWVYDSYWNLVMQSTAAASKEIQVFDSGDIQAQVDAYNKAHTTSQFFIESDATDIADAPPAMVYIVKPDTHELIKVFTDVPRSEFVTNAAQIDLECRADGGVMYVDNVPPAPIPADTTYKYYIYLIGSDGSVLFSTQTTADMFDITLRSYYATVYNYPGSRVVYGELYQP